MNKKNIIYYILLLFPFLDLITSLQTRMNPDGISVGIITKGLLVLFELYYIVFKSVSKHKKRSFIYLCLMFLFVVGYFIAKPDLLNMLYFKSEAAYIFKILFFPITYLFLINYFDEYGFNKRLFEKIMSYVLLEYTLLLLVPLLFKSAFESYTTGLHGYVGWFYAANEVSVIMILLLPFIYCFLNKTKKYNFVIALPILYCLSSIGTKVSLIGCMTILFVGFIVILIQNHFKFNYLTIGAGCILLIGGIFFLGINNISVNNVKQSAHEKNFKFIETKRTTHKKRNNSKSDFDKQIDRMITFFLSKRNKFYLQKQNIYENTYEDSYLVFGMGFSNTERIDNKNMKKLIEIDYLDLYFHVGLLGLMIELIPIIEIGCVLIKYLFTSKEKKIKLLLNITALGLVLSCAGIAGHVLFYPAVALYLVIYMMYTYALINFFDKKIINDNKISLLALHLKEGGIETVLTNQANMLSKDYDVEIISLYKAHGKTNYKLNDNIKVKYLMNTISNKDELINSLRKFNIIKSINLIFKSIKILYLKPRLLKKFILSSDSKIIISTRTDFSDLLGKYKREGVIAISEEHSYHNNNQKIINNTIKANKKVDYLLPTSQELTNFYSSLVKCKTQYIPNVINHFPKNINKINNKKLIAIGRLTPEKGMIDLVSIMKEVVQKDNSIVLDIYGDGKEKSRIEELIKKEKLENNISLKGFVSLEKLNQIRNDYSLMLIPSYEESFGLAALESMAFGIPCIAYSDAKGLQEFINVENGVIIENRDYKQFANNILDLLNNKNKLKKLSMNARKTAEQYSIKNISEIFNKFIKQIILDSKKRRVLFVSSTGGHFNELLQLSELFNKYNYEIITEKTETNKNLRKNNKKIHYLLYGTRFHPLKYFLFILPCNIFINLYYYFKYNPEFIITTGTHTAAPMCCIGKLYGSKVIFIESFANIFTKTVTGNQIYKFADLFIVQWDSMLELYPNAKMGGWIF